MDTVLVLLYQLSMGDIRIKHDVIREHKYPPNLVCGVWNSLARQETSVAPYAVFHNDHLIITWIREEQNVHRIWITMEKSFMKWAPAFQLHIFAFLGLYNLQSWHFADLFIMEHICEWIIHGLAQDYSNSSVLANGVTAVLH